MDKTSTERYLRTLRRAAQESLLARMHLREFPNLMAAVLRDDELKDIALPLCVTVAVSWSVPAFPTRLGRQAMGLVEVLSPHSRPHASSQASPHFVDSSLSTLALLLDTSRNLADTIIFSEQLGADDYWLSHRREFEVDLLDLQGGTSAAALASRPLWRSIPEEKILWTIDKKQIESRRDGWRPWVDWYERRLSGGVFPERVEVIFARVPPHLWEQPLDGNAWIRSQIAEITKPRPTSSSLPHRPDEATRKSLLERVPTLPAQRAGIYFHIREDGILDIAPPEALDDQGNNVATLRELHADLVSLARELVHVLDKSNPIYPQLLDRAKAYEASIDKPLQDISFGAAYRAGLRLQNSFDATLDDIGRRELPALSASEKEPLQSLLAMHGPFILNSAIGSQLLFDERQYKRLPEEERELQAAALNFGERLLDRPDIMNQSAARVVVESAEEMGTGRNPARSSSFGEGVMYNAAVGVIGIASIIGVNATITGVVGGPLGVAAGAAAFWPLNEALKKTKSGGALNEAISKGFDRLTHERLPQLLADGRQLIAPHFGFALKLAPELRRLARASSSVAWLARWLDWLEEVERTADASALAGEGLHSDASPPPSPS